MVNNRCYFRLFYASLSWARVAVDRLGLAADNRYRRLVSNESGAFMS
jgi:hypothetical protein